MWKEVIDFSILLTLSICGYVLVKYLIKNYSFMFLTGKANLYGIDLNKNKSNKIPESQGLWCGVVYFIIMFLFMPISNSHYFMDSVDTQSTTLIQHLAGLLSICCMTMLGFVDDVLDLKWRHKLLLPTVASLPLLIVYFISKGATFIVVPVICRSHFGGLVDIGILYYIYMGMLAVFCTNAINIYAGVNGIEVGQSVIIAFSVCCFNVIELFGGRLIQYHQFSLFFIVPYLLTSLALFQANWYPAEVFVGDTFCYFSGMTFAVVGILGHFSKTLLLFFLPQIFNFVYSVPQLFHFIPCPRHRLPRYVASTDKLTQSMTRFKPGSLSKIGRFCFYLLTKLRLVTINRNVDTLEVNNPKGDHKILKKTKETGKSDQPESDEVEINNLTIINMMLRITGDQHEEQLTKKLLYFQIFSSFLALFIRYPIAWMFY